MEMEGPASEGKSVYERMAKFNLQDKASLKEMDEGFESITDLGWSVLSSPLCIQFSLHAKQIILKKAKFMPTLIELVGH